MSLLRKLFPSFEKPTERPRYLNIEPPRRDFRGIGMVLTLALACGVGIAMWEPSHPTFAPVVAAGRQNNSAAADTAKDVETTAAAETEVDDDPQVPTVKLTQSCSQRPTARRECADVRAFKESMLTKPVPEASKAAPVKPVVAETPAVQPPPASQRTAAAPKAKKPRVQDQEAPVERLVRVYDQVMPDGRRVPVYRRVGSGGYETGTIVDGEYRPARRANLERTHGPVFGLQ